jgi:hypothetical protein
MEGYPSLLVNSLRFSTASAGLLLGSLFAPDDRHEMFLRKSGCHQTTRHYNSQDPIFHCYRRDNLPFINPVESNGTGKDIGISDAIVA